jgi:sugar/nucleoside kinase (ribokinase family)
MDLVVEVPTIPRPGETILGDNFATFPGGKGANQAVAAARLGARVSLIAVSDKMHSAINSWQAREPMALV